MKDKQFDPARHNERSPAPGLAAVNTHNPEEKEPDAVPPQQVSNLDLLEQREDEEKRMNEERRDQ